MDRQSDSIVIPSGFNPTTHEWNMDFATPNVGSLGIPGIGEFKNDRGDFTIRNGSTEDIFSFDFRSGRPVRILPNPNRHFQMTAGKPGR